MMKELSCLHFTCPNLTISVQNEKSFIYYRMDLMLANSLFDDHPKQKHTKAESAIHSHIREKVCTKSHSVVFGDLMVIVHEF